MGPFELKTKSSILTSRGGCVVNAPESPRQLCCEIGTMNVGSLFFGEKMENAHGS